MLSELRRIAFAGLCMIVTIGVTAEPAQTGVRHSPGSQTYWVEEVAKGLKFPSSLVWLPTGEALIAERQGGLRLLRGHHLDPKPIEGMPQSFQNAYNGIKDIALDPDYSSNQYLYLLISEGSFEQHHAAIYRARYTSAGLKEVERIFRSQEDIAGVGPIATRMIFLADKTLLFGVAEDDLHKIFAQQLSSHLGKLLRIHRDGSIPTDNPFLKTAEALPEIWSVGHRVTTGLYLDPETAGLWQVEPGPKGGDELNALKRGGNFGWARATWGFDYSGGPAAPLQSGPGIEDPLLVWTPSVTPSGLTRYRGRPIRSGMEIISWGNYPGARSSGCASKTHGSCFANG